jgi:rRNA maturation protein Nop10
MTEKWTLGMKCPVCGTPGRMKDVPNLYTLCSCPTCKSSLVVMLIQLQPDGSVSLGMELYHDEIDPELWEKKIE